MHSALEEWWRHGPEAAFVWLSAQAGALSGEDGAKIAALLTYYAPPRDRYTVVEVEMEFDVPVVNPDTRRPMREYRFGGRVDVAVRDERGQLWLVEHKTTSSEILGYGPYWQRLGIDAQVGYYLLATGAVGILYDVLRKPGLRVSRADEQKAAALGIDVTLAYQKRMEAEIAASPDSFYQVREIVKSADDLLESAADLYEQVQMLHSCHRRGMFPRNSNSCIGLYGTCPYLEVCSGSASLDDPALFRDREGP